MSGTKIALIIVIILILLCLISKVTIANNVNDTLSGLWYIQEDSIVIYLFINKQQNSLFFYVHDANTGEVLNEELLDMKVDNKMGYLKVLCGDLKKITYSACLDQSESLPDKLRLELYPFDMKLNIYDDSDLILTLYKNPVLQDPVE